MRTIEVEFPDSQYFELVGKAAQEQKEVDEYIERLARQAIDVDEDDTHETFEKFAIHQFDLEPGVQQTANVVGVLNYMRKGRTWQEAVSEQAKDYAESNEKIKSAEIYEDTVRDSCTRRLNLSTGEFQQTAMNLIDSYGGSSRSGPSGPTTSTSSKQATSSSVGGSRRYIVRLSRSGEYLRTFGDTDNMDQAEVMQTVVNHLIEEHNLIDKIRPLPYVVQTKALINDEPKYPDGNERMRHYKELTGGYFLDTHYSKEDKRRRLEDLIGTCGLSVVFEGDW